MKEIIHDLEYKEILLLKNYTSKGFFKSRLDKILDYFHYADMKKGVNPKFVRFDFDNTWTKQDVLSFFKQAKKWHSKKNMFFAYLCNMEEDEFAEIHYHAFCIVDCKNYNVRKKVIKMLSKRSQFLLLNNKNLSKIFVSRKPNKKHISEHIRKYNFYSISTHKNANQKERQEALTAASYLAKVAQYPCYSKLTRERTFFGSKIPTLSKDEIRKGYKLKDKLK